MLACSHMYTRVHGRRQKPFVTNVFFQHTHIVAHNTHTHAHTCVAPVKRKDIRGKLFCCRPKRDARWHARTRMCKNPSDRYRRGRARIYVRQFRHTFDAGPGTRIPNRLANVMDYSVFGGTRTDCGRARNVNSMGI